MKEKEKVDEVVRNIIHNKKDMIKAIGLGGNMFSSRISILRMRCVFSYTVPRTSSAGNFRSLNINTLCTPTGLLEISNEDNEQYIQLYQHSYQRFSLQM